MTDVVRTADVAITTAVPAATSAADIPLAHNRLKVRELGDWIRRWLSVTDPQASAARALHVPWYLIGPKGVEGLVAQRTLMAAIEEQLGSTTNPARKTSSRRGR